MKHTQPISLSLRSLAIAMLLSQASCGSVYSLHQHQASDVQAKTASGGEENNEYVDMSSMGARISNLQMSMLNKKESVANQNELELSPSDDQMILINSHINESQMQRTRNRLHQKQKMRLRARSRKQDLDEKDIMAYSAGEGEQSAEKPEEPSIFGSSGAFAEALAENDPSLKEDEAPKLSEGELLKIKQEKEKKRIAAQKLAQQKAKEAEEKRKKEEQLRKQQEKKAAEAKAQKDAQENDQLQRQTHLLQSFLDDDKETQKENESDYYYIKNPKKSLSSLATQNVQDQTEVETANDIIQKSRKTILTGMDGGLNI